MSYRGTLPYLSVLSRLIKSFVLILSMSIPSCGGPLLVDSLDVDTTVFWLSVISLVIHRFTTMLLQTGLFLSIVSIVSASTPPTRHLFSNPPFLFPEYHIPTVHESAILARRILNLSSIATLSTVFPSTFSTEHEFSTLQQPPSDLGGAPVGLMDYYASCSPQTHSPTILAISIATTFRNERAGSNVTLSLRVSRGFENAFPYWGYLVGRKSTYGSKPLLRLFARLNSHP